MTAPGKLYRLTRPITFWTGFGAQMLHCAKHDIVFIVTQEYHIDETSVEFRVIWGDRIGTIYCHSNVLGTTFKEVSAEDE